MSPAVACSPPAARSPAVPIGSAGRSTASIRCSSIARVSSDGGSRAEDSASPLLRPAARFSFTGSGTPASSAPRGSSSAASSLRAARPPAGPSAVKAQNVLVGFDAPTGDRAAAPQPAAPVPAAPPSPARRGAAVARPSLLSLALSDLPAGPVSGGLAFSPPLDLFGAASPSSGLLRRQVCAPAPAPRRAPAPTRSSRPRRASAPVAALPPLPASADRLPRLLRLNLLPQNARARPGL